MHGAAASDGEGRDSGAGLPAAIGPYRIVRKLGEGGMGVVYEGLNEALARRVAIKVLHAEVAGSASVVERFFNEARAVNLIEHPSLIQISDFGRQPDGSAYLVMELLRGESLAARMRRGPLPAVMLLQVAWQLADALVAVHAKDIVHRDLKPDNLMLVPEPVAPGGERVKILDFGIAKLAHAVGHKTQSNILIGTPAYMSPEQCKGAGQVEVRSDVYSLGVVLFEAIAGRPPFLGDSGELIARHLFEQPPPVRALAPRCDRQLAQLVDRMLCKEREQRPDMSQVRRELLRMLAKHVSPSALQSLTPLVEPSASVLDPRCEPSTLERSVGQTETRRRRRQLGLVLAAALSAVAAGGLLRWSQLGRIGQGQTRQAALPPKVQSLPATSANAPPSLSQPPPEDPAAPARISSAHSSNAAAAPISKNPQGAQSQKLREAGSSGRDGESSRHRVKVDKIREYTREKDAHFLDID